MTAAPNPLYFVICFPLFWFAVTLLLSLISGWFGLMERYPDHGEAPLAVLANQSGSLGAVSMRGILKLSVCPSGLRVGIMRIFGPFCREFFVPWSEITITRGDLFFWKVAKLSFGQPPIGKLTVFADVADRMACAAGNHWPEPGTFAEQARNKALSRIAKQWLFMTILASAFFIVIPWLVSPKGAGKPPLVAAILFPAVVFGIVAAVQYLRRQRP